MLEWFDTPETHHPTKPVQRFGPEASGPSPRGPHGRAATRHPLRVSAVEARARRGARMRTRVR